MDNYKMKKIIGDLEVTGTIINPEQQKQYQEYQEHTHNLHTSVTVPISYMFINSDSPHKLMIKSNIQQININGATTTPIKNEIYQESSANTFQTADGYKMTVEER